MPEDLATPDALPLGEPTPLTGRVRGRAVVWIAGSIAILAALAGAASALLPRRPTVEAPTAPSRAVSVDGVALALGNLDVTSRYPGQLVTDTADIAARVAGPVEEVAVRLGDRVERGQLLVRIDDRLLVRELAEARARMAADRASAGGASVRQGAAARELERGASLQERNVLSAQELDALHTEADAGQADAAAAGARATAARAHVDLLHQQIDDTRVTAPFSGTVALRRVDPGAYVRVGDPLLRLVHDGPLRVQFRLPERDIGLIEPGDRFELEVQIAQPLQVGGEVVKLAGEVTPSDRTLLVEGVVAEHASLRPGMYAEVRVRVQRLEQVPVVPASAVLEQVDAAGARKVGLFVAEEGIARFVPVEVRGREGERVAIAGEVSVGQTVLIRGHRELGDGAVVRVSESDRSGP